MHVYKFYIIIYFQAPLLKFQIHHFHFQVRIQLIDTIYDLKYIIQCVCTRIVDGCSSLWVEVHVDVCVHFRQNEKYVMLIESVS